MKKTFGTICLLLLALVQLYAQSPMIKRNGHFIAYLDFLGNYPLNSTAGRVSTSLDYGAGLTNTDQKRYNEKGVEVYGLVKSALLKVDWWPLFGEPTEQYQFEWISSGYYDISFNDSQGKLITTKINKSDLVKYPDLLKRFDNLAPTEMEFEIYWKLGKPNDTDIKKIEAKHSLDLNFYSGLGSNYLNINRLYKTTVKNGSLLFEPSGITPFATPSIRPGKGKEFLGNPEGNYTENDVKRILNWWQFCQTHTIDGFRVTRQNWPIDEMKAIAEKYLAYESGKEEPTPKEQIAKELEKDKNTQAYAKDDFWADAMEETFVESEINSSRDNKEFQIKEQKTGKITFSLPKGNGSDLTKIGKYFYLMAINPNPSVSSKRYERYFYLVDHTGKKKKLGGYEQFIDIKKNDNSTSTLLVLISEKLLRTIKLNINWDQSPGHEFTTDCNLAESQILNYKNPPKGADANAYLRKLVKITIDNNTLNVIKIETGCDASAWWSFQK